MGPPVYFADDLEVGQSLDLGTWTPTAAEIVELHNDDDELVARVIGDGLMARRRRIE